MEALHILLLAAIFATLGVVAGALIYALLLIMVSLLKIGLLLVAAIVVSGFVMRGCTPPVGKVATGNTSAMKIGLNPQIDEGNQRIRRR